MAAEPQTDKPVGSYGRLKNKWQTWKKEKILQSKGEPTEEEKLLGQDWNELGAHRPLGGLFYEFGTYPGAIVIGILLLPLLSYTVYAFPEIESFEAIAGGLFAAVYSILDLESASSVDRFVPQYALSDPRKATRYASFFIKYQMWSGLSQVTFLSIIILTMVRSSNLGYLTLFLLFINVKQYPGMLGVFDGLLASYQRLNKTALRGFLQVDIVQNITGPVCGVIGMFWGANNPQFGILFGLALGYAIGKYIDDFFGLSLGAYYYSKVLKEIYVDIRLRDVFFQKIGKDVWAPALKYSLKRMPSTIFGSVMGFFGWSITVNYVPGYATYSGLVKQSENIVNFSTKGYGIFGKSRAAMSEAYNNGKYHLTKFYIANAWKYGLLLFFALAGVISLGFSAVLPAIIQAGFMSKGWIGIGAIIPIYTLLKTWTWYDDIHGKMIEISDHVEVNTILGIIGTIVNIIFTFLMIVLWQWGWLGIILAGVPAQIMNMVVRGIFVYKKLLPLDKAFWKDIVWQVFVAPSLAMGGFMVVLLVGINVMYPSLLSLFPDTLMIIPLLITILFIFFVGLIIVYFPLYAFFGGMDEYGLEVFRKSVALTGPGMILAWPIYKLLRWGYKHSPFKRLGQMKMVPDVKRELLELAYLRKEGKMKTIGKST